LHCLCVFPCNDIRSALLEPHGVLSYPTLSEIPSLFCHGRPRPCYSRRSFLVSSSWFLSILPTFFSPSCLILTFWLQFTKVWDLYATDRSLLFAILIGRHLPFSIAHFRYGLDYSMLVFVARHVGFFTPCFI